MGVGGEEMQYFAINGMVCLVSVVLVKQHKPLPLLGCFIFVYQ